MVQHKPSIHALCPWLLTLKGNQSESLHSDWRSQKVDSSLGGLDFHHFAGIYLKLHFFHPFKQDFTAGIFRRSTENTHPMVSSELAHLMSNLNRSTNESKKSCSFQVYRSDLEFLQKVQTWVSSGQKTCICKKPWRVDVSTEVPVCKNPKDTGEWP